MAVEKSFSKHGHGVALVHLLSRCYTLQLLIVAKTQLLSLVQQMRTLRLSFLAICHVVVPSSPAEYQVVRKFYLQSACGPRGFALNCSVKNIRNDV